MSTSPSPFPSSTLTSPTTPTSTPHTSTPHITTTITTTTTTITPPTPPTPSFTYPAHHAFPPFYTLQPNLTTRASQLTSWSALILAYCAHHRIYRLNPSSPLFANTTLNRRLAPDDARLVFAHLAAKARVEWVSAPATPDAGDGDVWVWWRTPEEWAALVGQWVEETGQRGVVLTFYELVQGDATRGCAFHGLPREMLGTAMVGLARRGKVGVLGEGEEGGVKFY